MPQMQAATDNQAIRELRDVTRNLVSETTKNNEIVGKFNKLIIILMIVQLVVAMTQLLVAFIQSTS